MRLALLLDFLEVSVGSKLLCAAEGGTDVDDGVVGDLRIERTGFTTGVLGLGGDG